MCHEMKSMTIVYKQLREFIQGGYMDPNQLHQKYKCPQFIWTPTTLPIRYVYNEFHNFYHKKVRRNIVEYLKKWPVEVEDPADSTQTITSNFYAQSPKIMKFFQSSQTPTYIQVNIFMVITLLAAITLIFAISRLIRCICCRQSKHN